MAFSVAYLEMPITHICSLRCDGCSAYSNYGVKESVSLENALLWLKLWSQRITPQYFRILGGEPFIHPHLPEIFLAARRAWPDTAIQVVTNGLNLDRHKIMPHLLAQRNTTLHISIHSDEPAYMERLKEGVAIINDWAAKYGVATYSSDNVKFWNRFYLGIGREMRPFEDGDPVASWKACHSQHCLNLVHNRLWKCPQIGNLPLIADRFDLHANPKWQKYLSYQGIGLDADDTTLHQWLEATKGPESICDMCPKVLDHYKKDVYNTTYDMPGVERVERSICPA